MKIRLLAFLCALPLLMEAQNYPRDYFKHPLDFPLIITGTFGEIRNNHFHAGIDLSTNGLEGVPVMAAADGYVSRVKISADGYGKALYVTHPNGYVTVYAHLEKFMGSVLNYTRRMQHEKQVFELDINPTPEQFPVKQSQVIGYSGNTGSSNEPHLHFEIRDQQTEEPINPLLFGISVNDSVAPVIKFVRMYPQREGGIINSTDSAETYYVMMNEGRYELSTNEIPLAFGNVAFGIGAIDYQYALIKKESEPQEQGQEQQQEEPIEEKQEEDNDVANEADNEEEEEEISDPSPLGIYSAELFVDDSPVYTWRYDRLNFDLMRDVNAHIDYRIKMRTDDNIERCHKLPGNRLKIYGDEQLTGYLNFSNDANHAVKIVVRDFKGNTSEISFQVVSYASLESNVYMSRPDRSVLITPQKGANIQKSNLKVVIPEGAVYDNMFYSDDENEGGNYSSAVFTVGDVSEPLKAPITIGIKPKKDIPDSLKSKATLVRLDLDGVMKPFFGQWNEKFLTAQCNTFGEYAIVVDTIAPLVAKFYVPADLNTMWGGQAMYKVKDAICGLKSYSGKIDGKWHLFEYDKNDDMLIANVDGLMGNSDHVVELTVTDACGNTRVWTSSFYY